ncbi:MAG: hypothetical protein C3F13_07475 [Anaerolineales bacterium]|nr:MAG: hypothetical protein C3F13_07475 [Anaerolineales bacterium]
MAPASRIKIALKAATQLGVAQVGLFALYRFGLKTGHYQRALIAARSRLEKFDQASYLKIHPVLAQLPAQDRLKKLLGEQAESLNEQADEIVKGQIRLFGGKPVPLSLSLSGPLKEWADYEQGDGQVNGQDIKFIWEAGRFGWACTLARAYHLGGNENYASSFWEYTEQFLSSNLAYLGPQWASAQEVAIRIISLAFAIQVFAGSKYSTPARLDWLARAIAIHAERIPATMVYARSQNNNHLITEALGLYTASALLRDHPLAARWNALGWKWLQRAFRLQIASDGTYVQHSTNYHRLMLQAALWMYAVHGTAYLSEPISPEIQSNLASATVWLWQLLDSLSGKVPNLGHNDGAYILPLTISPYEDYRPVISAAAQGFLNIAVTPEGPWQELSLWLCEPADSTIPRHGFDDRLITRNPGMVEVNPGQIPHQPANNSWAALRIAHFNSRPAHADQLHVDLWWQGINLAQDAGTYLYNSAPPWDNSLVTAFVHNTLTVDGQEFMLHAGRFLYLDWAQAQVCKSEPGSDNLQTITASHNGYRKLGMVHTRTLAALSTGDWEITDRVTGPSTQPHTIRLHWLVPDLEYEVREPVPPEKITYEVRLRSPFGWVTLSMGQAAWGADGQPIQNANFRLIRAGQLVYGSGEANPIAGWVSRIYGTKEPALACILETTQRLPVELKSQWTLPHET